MDPIRVTGTAGWVGHNRVQIRVMECSDSSYLGSVHRTAGWPCSDCVWCQRLASVWHPQHSASLWSSELGTTCEKQSEAFQLTQTQFGQHYLFCNSPLRRGKQVSNLLAMATASSNTLWPLSESSPSVPLSTFILSGALFCLSESKRARSCGAKLRSNG